MKLDFKIEKVPIGRLLHIRKTMLLIRKDEIDHIMVEIRYSFDPERRNALQPIEIEVSSPTCGDSGSKK